MAVTITPFVDLDSDLVDQIHREVTTRFQEDNAAADTRRGPVGELCVYPHALLEAQLQTALDDYLKARSLKDIEADPDVADEDNVSAVISNFGLTRREGSRAAGEVLIVLSDNLTVTIASGAVFLASGRRYLATRAFTAKAEAAQVSGEGDRVYTETAEGNYSFTVEVEAEEEGPEYRIRKDVLVVPASLPANYVNSYAASDFSGGEAVETNTELLARQRQGISDKKALSNRQTMQAWLRSSEDELGAFVHSSIIGLGDAEMLRDRHTLWPSSLGGRVDWYVRTQAQAQRTSLTVTATLVEVETGGTSIWQFGLGKDDAPGFYEITGIRPEGSEETSGSYEVVLDSRSVDLTGDGFLPDIETAEEGAYSRFQTAVIRFRDTRPASANLGVGARQDYDIEAVHMPRIDLIQDEVSSRNVSHYGADCLVKAPVPCFVQLALTIHRQRTETAPDTEAIKAALVEEVNAIGFTGRLYASQLVDTAHAYLHNATSVSSIDMIGRIRYPDGSIEYLRSSEVLEAPDAAGQMVSAKTVQFIVDPDDILISVAVAVPATP